MTEIGPENGETMSPSRFGAEIRRMAEMVGAVVRRTSLDGLDAALGAAGDRRRAETAEIARQVLGRAETMQSEVERFLAISRRGGEGER